MIKLFLEKYGILLGPGFVPFIIGKCHLHLLGAGPVSKPRFLLYAAQMRT